MCSNQVTSHFHMSAKFGITWQKRIGFSICLLGALIVLFWCTFVMVGLVRVCEGGVLMAR